MKKEVEWTPLEELRQDALRRIEEGEMLDDEQWSRLSLKNLVFECIFRINRRLKNIEDKLK